MSRALSIAPRRQAARHGLAVSAMRGITAISAQTRAFAPLARCTAPPLRAVMRSGTAAAPRDTIFPAAGNRVSHVSLAHTRQAPRARYARAAPRASMAHHKRPPTAFYARLANTLGISLLHRKVHVSAARSLRRAPLQAQAHPQHVCVFQVTIVPAPPSRVPRAPRAPLAKRWPQAARGTQT